MSMIEELDFIKAILSTPKDDLPRLVYADWLDEHGRTERAEFIRVQCEIGSWRTAPPADAEKWLRREKELSLKWLRREKELSFALSWPRDNPAIPLQAWYSVMPVRFIYERGFVARIECPAEEWVKHADEVFWHPDQKATCPCCDGEREVAVATDRAGKSALKVGGSTYLVRPRKKVKCPECDGSGTVDRPCPPGAQPLEVVRFTTLPFAGARTCPHIDERYPGLLFELSIDPARQLGNTHWDEDDDPDSDLDYDSDV